MNKNTNPRYSQLSIDVRYFENTDIDKVLEDIIKKLMSEHGKLAVVGSDIHDMNEQYKDFKTNELCGNCGTEVNITANKFSLCPECGKEIYPCSMCGNCVTPCPCYPEESI